MPYLIFDIVFEDEAHTWVTFRWHTLNDGSRAIEDKTLLATNMLAVHSLISYLL